MNGVKYYRIQKGLTQKDLAKLADINPQVLARMEHMGIDSGLEGAMPDNYLMLRKVLCVPVDELVREDLPEDTETLYKPGHAALPKRVRGKLHRRLSPRPPLDAPDAGVCTGDQSREPPSSLRGRGTA